MTRHASSISNEQYGLHISFLYCTFYPELCTPQGYTDEPIEKILLHVDEGPVEEMDRWMINVWKNPQVQVMSMDC